MSSVAGELLIDLAVQYVLPYLLRQASGVATRPAAGEKSRPGSREHASAAALRLVPSAGQAPKIVVMSQTPGRIRLRVDGLRGDATREARFAAILPDVAGVRLVRANRLTGTVLVEFDPGRIGVRDILTSIERAALAPAAGSTGRTDRHDKARKEYPPHLILAGA